MTTMLTEPKASASPGLFDFRQGAFAALRQLRSAVSAVISGIPAVPGRRTIASAADLQRILEVPTTLAWKVHKLAYSTDPAADIESIPGQAAFKRFLQAAEEAGVPHPSLQSAASAVDEFEDFVKSHAGDRRTFESMVSGLAEDGSEKMDLAHKRAAFKAQSHFLGLQAKTHLGCFVYRPSEADPDQLDWLIVRGMVGLRRLRQNASWIISRTRVVNDDGTMRHSYTREPLDPKNDETHGISLLREFCSRPLPKLRRVTAGLGFMNVEVVGEGVGNSSAQTCFVADVYRKAFVRYRDEHNATQASVTHVRTPCEALLADVLVYEGTFGDPNTNAIAQLNVFSDHRVVDPVVTGGVRECDRLTVSESVTYLGKGVEAMHTPDVPRYPEMIGQSLARLGWEARKFDVYRCRIEFPIMPSSVVVQFDLPTKPGQSTG